MSGHVPVLLKEAVSALLEGSAPAPRVWLDGTFGRGGHSRALLDQLPQEDRLIVIDRDPVAVAAARELAAADARVSVLHGEWSHCLSQLGELTLAGALLDLGVSSPQLDDAERGFSFAVDGPLDMRMDTTRGETAAQWLNSATEQDISRVLWDYGEERFARRIARSIVAARPLSSTGELRDAVLRALPARAGRGGKRGGKHDATRSFQAVRIYINDELAGLERVLPDVFSRLAPGARLAVITFHSLEDRVVKRFFKACSSPPSLPRNLPVRAEQSRAPARLVGRSRTPPADEVRRNVRARSARLRVLERCA